MNIIIFGPAGSGKGTQADLLAEKLKLYHMSMGDELRAEIKRGTSLGAKIDETINKRGKLVSDTISNRIIRAVSKKKQAKKGLIFDGYPRRYTQFLYIKKNFKVGAVFELKISSKETIHRMSTRRICPKCGHNYNIIWLKPKKAGYCDFDKTKLVHRPDDMPAQIKKRLQIYHSQTEPLKKEYEKLGILHVVNGEQPIKKVHQDILNILKNIKMY